MEKKNLKLDLTWLLYVAYVVLLACSLNILSSSWVKPAVFTVNGISLFVNFFLVIGIITSCIVLKQLKTRNNIKTTVNKPEQKKYLWVLLLEVGLVCYLSKILGSQLNILVILISAKVVLTAIFLIVTKLIQQKIVRL